MRSYTERCIQARPNPAFGGSKQEAAETLKLFEGYMPLHPGPPAVQQLLALCDSQAAAPAIDAAFDALPQCNYQLIPQLSRAWFLLRQRVPCTGSRLWGLCMLPLVPSRRRGDFQPDSRISMPPHRKGMIYIVIACCL